MSSINMSWNIEQTFLWRCSHEFIALFLSSHADRSVRSALLARCLAQILDIRGSQFCQSRANLSAVELCPKSRSKNLEIRALGPSRILPPRKGKPSNFSTPFYAKSCYVHRVNAPRLVRTVGLTTGAAGDALESIPLRYREHSSPGSPWSGYRGSGTEVGVGVQVYK